MSGHPALPRWLLRGAFALALLAVAVFAVRSVSSALYWADPAHRDQQIAGWMPPRYVARSWDVPPEVIAAALNIPEGAGRRNLDQIARDQGVSVEALIAQLDQAIAQWRVSADE